MCRAHYSQINVLECAIYTVKCHWCNIDQVSRSECEDTTTVEDLH